MGEVWSATDTLLEREVALKVLKREHADDPVFRARFAAEARHAASLSHPHVAAVLDYGELPADDDGGSPVPYLVMERVHGQPLSALLAEGKPLAPEVAADLIAPAAEGLEPAHAPGTVVVPDQVVDRTWGREHTVYDGPGPVVHAGFADPYCPRGRAAVLDAIEGAGSSAVGSGTLVVINGPRFSSRAESLWHQQAGWTVVGMTGMPEASIARELAMCFTTVALVTDHDAGVEGGEAVSHAEVLRVFGDNISGLKQTLRAAIGALPAAEDDDAATCACRRALDGLPLPLVLPT